MKNNKAYYTKILFEEIMPQIAKISNQSQYGYHGLSHTAQVAMFGIDISEKISADTLSVMLACGLHDCARTNDNWCTNHGPKAVPIAIDFLSTNYPKLSKQNVDKILYAVKNHTIGFNAPDEISACLWDSDRIRLSWEFGYRPEFFSTNRGHEIARMTKQEQQKYIDYQNKFLIDNEIKTREQIDFERRQDALQSTIGTEFKTK